MASHGVACSPYVDVFLFDLGSRNIDVLAFPKLKITYCTQRHHLRTLFHVWIMPHHGIPVDSLAVQEIEIKLEAPGGSVHPLSSRDLPTG